MTSLIRRALALFDPRTTRRFILAIAGSTVIATAEVIAVLLVVPLMQLLTGDTATGAIPLLRDLLGQPSDSTLAIILALIVILAFIGKGLTALAIRWWTMGFIARRSVDASRDLLRYYLQAPYSLHVARGSADFLRRLNDGVSQVFGQILTPTMTIITESITIILMSMAMLVVSPVPTIAIVLYFAAAGYIMQRTVKARATSAGAAVLQANLRSLRYAMQGFGGIKEIKLRNDHEIFVSRYANARMDSAMQLRTLGFLSEFPKYAMETLFIVGVGLMAALIYAQEPSERALGVLALFAVAGFRVMPSCVRLIASLNVVRSGQHALELVEDDFEAARRFRAEPIGGGDPLPLATDLRLEGLRFRYDDGDRDVLKSIDLQILSGTSLALVGSSGAGKSTLVDLILGLRPPTAGRIQADGVDVHRRLQDWQASLAMVPQDVYLLEGSLRDNVHFTPGTEDPDDKRLMRVLEQAQLLELVDALPNGLDTEVGERGTRLSGGQRQRVGIARALFRQPKLLVLDEATSSLDNQTERQVTDTMTALHGELTLIVVAHRLSTVRECDQIAFLEGGELAAIGSFDEVRRANRAFARLVELGSLTTKDESVPTSRPNGVGD